MNILAELISKSKTVVRSQKFELLLELQLHSLQAYASYSRTAYRPRLVTAAQPTGLGYMRLV